MKNYNIVYEKSDYSEDRLCVVMNKGLDAFTESELTEIQDWIHKNLIQVYKGSMYEYCDCSYIYPTNNKNMIHVILCRYKRLTNQEDILMKACIINNNQ